MQVTITIRGSSEVKSRMRKLGVSLYDFSTAMQKIGEWAARYYASQGFISQGGVYGNVWPRLSARTVYAKSKLYPQHVNTPLVASGKMKDSFMFTSNKEQVIIGNKMPYYKYHQSTAPRHKIPRRQMAGVNDPIKQIVRSLIREDIARKLRVA